MKNKIYFLLAVLTVGVLCAPALTQAQYQTRNTHFGVSGGNINDISRRFCCSGTLGSLVNNGTTQYILSNNHVLARTDQAAAGEDISQPGLIDNNCQTPPIVADLTAKVALGNNVDCAIAAVRAGQMDSRVLSRGLMTRWSAEQRDCFSSSWNDRAKKWAHNRSHHRDDRFDQHECDGSVSTHLRVRQKTRFQLHKSGCRQQYYV